MTFPTEPNAQMSAERVIAADVAAVYRTIEAVDRWSSWVEGVVAPVKALDHKSFEVSRVHDGRITTHHVEITARGPVHSLTVEVDHRYRIQFRTRPHPSGAHVKVMTEPFDASGWLERRSNRRRGQRAGVQLEPLLDRLSAHLASGG